MAVFQDIINSNKPVLIDFSAEWCGPCKMMAPILKEVAGALGDEVRVLKIDVDRNKHVANQYNIQGVPTLMLFREGKLLWRQSGVIQAGQLIGIIHSYTQQKN